MFTPAFPAQVAMSGYGVLMYVSTYVRNVKEELSTVAIRTQVALYAFLFVRHPAMRATTAVCSFVGTKYCKTVRMTDYPCPALSALYGCP